eukprot:PhM_4_TR5379/c0_g1_i1/m.85466/K00823/puuE; 4-aminobutyrate aminotransferase
MTSHLTKEFASQYLARGLSPAFSGAVVESAKGLYIFDVNGNKYVDCTTGIAVCSLGHCHPAVSQAIKDQADNLIHGQVNIVYHKPMLDLVKRMNGFIDTSKFNSYFFTNSGAEAVENAMKLARHATGRSCFVAVQGSYHGRTFGTMSITSSKNIYHKGLHPLLGGTFFTPFPHARQMDLAPDTPESVLIDKAVRQFEDLLQQQVSAEEVAMVIVEPVLGEGGYVPAPAEYMRRICDICKKNGILFCCDEVQSGAGRTGSFFAYQQMEGVDPDVVVFAKGIASGAPLSGFISRKELTDKQLPGTMGGTYAGNALSCAAANAVLETFEKESILDNVKARGAQLRSGLERIAASNKNGGLISEVRGLGLMQAAEFDPTVKGFAKAVSDAALEKHRLLLMPTSKYEVIRFMPPLNITESETDLILDLFDKSLAEVAVPMSKKRTGSSFCCQSPCMKGSTCACRTIMKN